MQFISKCCNSFAVSKYDHYECLNCKKKLKPEEVENINTKRKKKQYGTKKDQNV